MKRKTGFSIAALSVAAVLAMSGCANQGSGGGGEEATSDRVELPKQETLEVSPDVVKAAGDGNAKCDSKLTIAYVGAMTGPNAQLGINIYNGAQTAIDEHNAANPDCQVAFKKFDTEGDPAKATGPVAQATKEENIIGVIGTPFSGESKATGGIFEDAGLAHITPSATNPGLSENGWTTFFRGLGNDTVQGPSLVKLVEKLQSTKTCLIEDDSDYGIGLAKVVREEMGDSLACEDSVTTGQKDFAPTIQKIMDAEADSVIYAGYFAEGAPLDNQLVNKGYEGYFIGPDGVKDVAFVEQAGDAANNAYYTCTCVPGDLIPEFAEAYEKVSDGAAPGTYSVEGYDTMTVMLSGIDSGVKDRKGMVDYVRNYDGVGYGKTYKWDEKGELEDKAVYGYKTEGDGIVSVGLIE
ncbi:amino acid/amide ABC transporter substrate-binding protein (HAAT family) [Brevibacterium sanguinis]|uniref:Amino acid/amide ABC transporter substrate-binding protein (HAAT family) n=2 Tax=Brevibacterium TaxID=1696 RepID=A0A366IIU4_9MICO|nr:MULTISPECIES: branched-chain amino acid ABC transporter substrate-binding protein [Brevibacterium]RBP64611.1 amino acid/amide ABC transporter substrate-binding protein (HAAT family) [Brevibacterium sanguinis]RBP71746.1 amino acid/amide ABC transporter substrate-binding protein (HAAT family) [Brevibacterium celere]